MKRGGMFRSHGSHPQGVTKEAVEELGLAEGSAVTALVKSTEVMLGVE